MNHTKLIRWPRLLLGIIIMLFSGVSYTWSILKAPLAMEFAWNEAQLAINYTIMLCGFSIGGFLSGIISNKTTPRFRTLVGAILVFVSFFACSKLGSNQIFILYIAFAASAIGIGVVYNTVISVTSTWFPDKKGLCSGLLLMFYAFSTMFLGTIVNALFDMPAFGWRTAYILLGTAIAIIFLIAAFLLRFPPEGATFPAPPVKRTKSKYTFEPVETNPGGLIKRRSFWLLFIFFTLLAGTGSCVISFAKDYALFVGTVEATAVLLVGTLSVFNGFGRVFAGWLFDYFGARATQIAASTAITSSIVLLLLGVIMQSWLLGAIGLCLCGFAYAFSASMSASFMLSFYGQKYFAANFSIINLVIIPGSIFSTIAGAIITATGSYAIVFIMLLSVSVIGIFVNLSVKRP